MIVRSLRNTECRRDVYVFCPGGNSTRRHRKQYRIARNVGKVQDPIIRIQGPDLVATVFASACEPGAREQDAVRTLDLLIEGAQRTVAFQYGLRPNRQRNKNLPLGHTQARGDIYIPKH